MYKVNFDTKILNFNNEPIKEYDKELTLRDVCQTALTGQMRDEVVSGTDKLKRYNLALKINTTGDISLSAEEIVMIKELTAKYLPILIVGRIYEIIEPK